MIRVETKVGFGRVKADRKECGTSHLQRRITIQVKDAEIDVVAGECTSEDGEAEPDSLVLLGIRLCARLQLQHALTIRDKDLQGRRIIQSTCCIFNQAYKYRLAHSWPQSNP